MPVYEDFKIVINSNDNLTFTVDVIKPCGGNVGDAHGNFKFDEIKLISDVLNNSEVAPPLAERNFKPVANNEKTLTLNYHRPLSNIKSEELGANLSDVLFKDDVREILGRCKEYCSNKQAILRIRLDLSRVPKLAELPWEYLRNTENDNFLCLDEDTTLVRYLQTADAVRPLKAVLPLRILVMASTPQNLPLLAKNDEINKIKNALAEISNDLIEIVVLEKPTINALKIALKKANDNEMPFHVFHFIGHGAFDAETDRGVLLFEDDANISVEVDHEDLGSLLQPYRNNLRLVLLNACEGAKISANNTYSSVAARLMQTAEIPAVIAMQYSITDKSAIEFSKSFYEELSKGNYLEGAIQTARKTLSLMNLLTEEWATPVFYLRADSGHLFDIRIPKPPDNLVNLGHYTILNNYLPSCNFVVFIGLDVNVSNRPYFSSWKPNRGLPNASELCSYISQSQNINPPITSLAYLAKKLQVKSLLNPDTLALFFSPPPKPIKLYQIWAEITRKITDNLSETVVDPLHCSMLFVTTTYDFSLEKAFVSAGIEKYNTVCYNRAANGNWIFSHNFFENGTLIFKNDLVAPEHTPNEYKQLKNKYPVILKLPGEIGSELNYAITEDDFFAFANKSLSELLPADLLGQINNSRHLYLGYDVQNWTLRLLLNRICENQSLQKKKGSYAVVFDQTNDPNTDFWGEQNITPAPANLEDYVAGLEEYVLNQM